MKKSITNLMVGALLAGSSLVAQAELITFSGLNAENTAGTVFGWAISNGNVTKSITADGLDNLYNFSVASLDLDGGGVNNDTLAFTIRHSAFNNGTKVVNGNDSSVTLGAAHGVDPTVGVNFGMADDGDGIEDMDNNDSMRWSIENINLTTDISGYVAVFNGFTGAFLTGGTGVDYILGEGASGLTSIDASGGNGNFVFAAQDVLTLTADTNNRGIRSLAGSFETVAVPEPSVLALLGVGLAALVLAHRR